MVLDLNRALLYGNCDGSLRSDGVKKDYITIVDGIIGGENNGPLCPDEVTSGVLIGGDDPAVVDAVACKLMGFNPQIIPIVKEAFSNHRWPISSLCMEDIKVNDQRIRRVINLASVAPAVEKGFIPHFGWGLISSVRNSDVIYNKTASI